MQVILFNFLTCVVITLVITPYVSGQSYGVPSCPCFDQKTEYTVVNQKVPWFQAYALCKLSNLKLASITSAEEEIAVESAINKVVPNNIGYAAGYWIAGARQGKDFIWLPSQELLSYRKFHPGQPSNLAEGCLEINFLNNLSNLGWNDYDCTAKLFYICQQTTCCGNVV